VEGQMRFDKCLAFILKEEGGYVNHPEDPGGITNLGVTKTSWERWVGKTVTEADMRKLTPDLVKPLYKWRYWDRVRGDELPVGVDLALMDFAVNSGPSAAIRCLQVVLQVEVDGIFGPDTMAALWKEDPNMTIARLCDAREDFLRSLPHFATFGRGWMNRLARVMSASLAARYN
jgi:lysozyme family protein